MNFPEYRPRRLRKNEKFRKMIEETTVSPQHLIYPLFVKEMHEEKVPVTSMPDIYQFSIEGLMREVEDVVGEIDAELCRTKVSRERGMQGRMLYSPTALNSEFKAQFRRRGWHERRTAYWVTDDARLIREILSLPPEEQKVRIEAAGSEPLRSYNQTDLQKGRVSIELQFGKYAFVAYDLFVKHLGFYVGDVIDVGIEMLPTKNLQRQMSSGVPYYEGALYDVVRQGRNSPPVPLVLVGLEC